MLRVSEELLLLLLDAASGDIQHSFPEHKRDVVMAGAVLMDLALENRIDMDTERLFLLDSKPVGDDLLDPTLADIAADAEAHDTGYWIKRVAAGGAAIRAQVRNRLTGLGILEADANGLVYPSKVFARTRRYPASSRDKREDVKSRVMAAIFSDEIPDPNDIIIIGLAAACGVFESILTRDELAGVRERIESISRLDLMGSTIRESLRTIRPDAPPERKISRPQHDIPEVPGLPLAGNAFRMAGDVREFLAACYREHGPIFRIRAFGYRFIAFAGPEANVFLGKISSTHLRSHEPYRTFSVAMGGHRALLNMDGAEHLRMRKVQVNGYSPKTLEANLAVAHDATRRILREWPQRQLIGVQRAMQEIIAEQIGICLTGVSPGGYVDDLIDYLGMVVSVHITKRWLPLVARLPKYRRADRRLNELLAKILEAHRPERRIGVAPDFIDDLLEVNRSDPQFLPETDFRANMIAPYSVGIDTSASVCAFMLYALLKHPDLLERMRAEVDEMYAGGKPTARGLRKLDVTHRVALETLRMYPVVPAIARTVSNSFEFGGYRVPAGADLLIGTTVPHHLPECYPDPGRFDIGRYSKGTDQHRKPGVFAPFGLGRHRCLGAGFSELQIALTMAAIVHEAELELDRPERPLRVELVPAPHPDKSLRVRLVNRRAA